MEFDSPGCHKTYATNGTKSAFDIDHAHAKLGVEVENGRLLLGLPILSEMVPNLSMTVTYRRRSTALFYPEVLLTVRGPIEVHPLT